MDLLERIFGVATMARARAAAREAQARPNASMASPGATARLVPPAAAAQRVAAPAPRTEPVASARALSDDLLAAAPPADFPTSILGTPTVARPPLLAAFASRDALLAAIVYSEVFAPPISLR